MVPNRPLFVALAIGALFWKGTDAQFANGFDNSRANGYSCPPGLLPLNSGNSDTAPIVCDQDPCYNDVIGCGPGKYPVSYLPPFFLFFFIP